jgi:predicted metal-binding membrane protein
LSVAAALPADARRTRLLILVAALVITALAALYIVWLALPMRAAGAMVDMPGMAMPALLPWSPDHALFLFGMWAVMMIGMMTPSVTPMVLIYARVMGTAHPTDRTLSPAGWFATGYGLAWCGFSAAAALLQWILEALEVVTPMMATASHRVGGMVLLAAGLYEWLPLKHACLAHCRAPLSFMQRHGGLQQGAAGSLRLGLLHGLYCIGCCWALMMVLFVAGVMNLLWIAALMVLVLLEKVLPHGHRLAQITGSAALAAGIWLIAN